MAELLAFDRRRLARPDPDAPPDAAEREQALDIRQSWIVEAPAGSGKTGLLMQRLLKLLADDSVTEPEQVLAITFTVKATAELRDRVLDQLEAAAAQSPLTGRFDRETRDLATAVLARDAALNWGLRLQPNRLRIRTIDSVCSEIARALPILSGSGRHLEPLLDATPLFRQAARQTLLQLGGPDAALDAALRALLLHRDADLNGSEQLLAEMLAWREQWGSLIPLSGAALSDHELDTTVLPRLERALDQAICAGLQHFAKSIPPHVLEALVFLAAEMGHAEGHDGMPSPIALCAGLDTAPEATAAHLEHWCALIHLLTTKDTTWRKVLSPRGLGFGLTPHHKRRLKELVDQLGADEDLLLPMKRVRRLPPAKYPHEQWAMLKSLFRVLARALVELQLVFAETRKCDFAELSLLARTALARDEHGDDLAAALGLRLQHLLVDEMQDTSTGQYDLIERLTQAWDGHSQTVFLVGDPRQSIYLFRQARVERFVRAMRSGKLGDLPLGRLRLSANFRSQARLVEQANADFARLFPPQPVPLHNEDVPFVAAAPVRDQAPSGARLWHTAILPPGLSKDDANAERRRQARTDATEIRRIVEDWSQRPLPPGRRKPWSLAVLVRSRVHLNAIVTALRETPAIPFRAVEIEELGERSEILDLFALTRALVHPADRIAWLAILRAPWCGLTLADLHQLSGADDPTLRDHTIPELLDQCRHLLTPDGAARATHLAAIVQGTEPGQITLAQQVHHAWRALGGDTWLPPDALANTARFFRLLDDIDTGASIDSLAPRLATLFAESASGTLDLMTIHKAKGLEWDVVIVPALERTTGAEDTRLLNWCELDNLDPDSAHVMLAPIESKGEDSRVLNRWLANLEKARHAAERKRLFYVACTRAREELHLFATAHTDAKGAVAADSGSLLDAAWPAAEPYLPTPPLSSFAKGGGPASALAHPPPPLSSFAETGSPPSALAGWGGEGGGPAFRTSPPPPELAQDQPLDLAAAADFPAKAASKAEPPPLLRRLPLTFNLAAAFEAEPPIPSKATPRPLPRPDGSFAARAFGNAVHTFLEALAHRTAQGASPKALLAELPTWTPRITAVLRAAGLPPAVIERLAQRALTALARTLRDPIGRWILAPHPGSVTEHALTTAERSLRLDRHFRAGPTPQAPAADGLYPWIIDFKTTTSGLDPLPTFLAQERDRYAPQMEAYARALPRIEAGTRLMLFYPLIPANIWWIAFS